MTPRPFRRGRSALSTPPRRGAAWRRAAVAVCLAGAAWRVRAQTAPEPAAARPAQDSAGAGAQAARAAVPFGPGERFTYDVKFGVLRVGSGSLEVAGVTNIRGREAYHTVLRVRGGTFFYKVDDRFESWFDTRTLSSLRFVQDQQEGRKERERKYEIFPERSAYRESDNPEQPSVDNPLDDGSFIYFVRTLPLRPGDVYSVDRYFKPDRNPVRIRVVRRERITVPAGTFDAVVVQPNIRTSKIFSEGGRAEIWFSDDEDRVMLQMKSQLSFGSLNLYLKSRQAGRKLDG